MSSYSEESVSGVRVTSGEAFADESCSGESRVRSVEGGAERPLGQAEVGPSGPMGAAREGTSGSLREERVVRGEDLPNRFVATYPSLFVRSTTTEAVEKRLDRIASECGLMYRIGVIADGRWPREVYNHGRNVVFYEDTFRAGFRILPTVFYVAVLEYFGLPPSQLIINAWRVVASYAVLCVYKGWSPSVGVLREMFTLKDQKGFYSFYP